MPRTVESIVESHRVASARRAAGKPIWDVKVPLKALLAEYAGFGDDLTAEQAVDMSHRLHALLKMCVPEAWRQYEHDNYSMDFEDLMERFELAAAVDFAPTEDCTDTPCEIINWWLVLNESEVGLAIPSRNGYTSPRLFPVTRTGGA